MIAVTGLGLSWPDAVAVIAVSAAVAVIAWGLMKFNQ